MIRAWPCAEVVITPACEPVNERASYPRLWIAMASSAMEIRSPGGEQHVQLAARRQRADLVGQVEQLVGGVAHRGDHHDHVVAGLAGGDDPLGHPLDPLGVGDGGAAVLLHDERHDGALPPSDT